MKKQHVIFDTEIIGKDKPVFLIGTKVVETGVTRAFWHHKRGHMKAFIDMLADEKYTWVGFNSENFDRPLISMALNSEYDVHGIKELATIIIEDRLKSWQTYREFGLDFVEYDHIDLFDVAPGVMISLKTYAGRMGYKTMVDMPMHHDKDLTPAEQKILEAYCLNDLGVTEALFNELHQELDLRREMSDEYGIDLRSKSDPQIAEAVLKKRVGIKSGDKQVPYSVRYTVPSFIQTDSALLNNLAEALKKFEFPIHRTTGSPTAPKFLDEPLAIGTGTYQCGVGGLHSTHDTCMHLTAGEDLLLSDFDVASYYPTIMLKAGLAPRLGGGKGELFLKEYQHIYDARMKAKHADDKKVANSLKICLNGTFGKLGNIYSSFFSPELFLAVTMTGQMNLLCLIHELTKIKGVEIRSANTDGLLVAHKPSARKRVLKVFADNSKRTGFEYEETEYLTYAAKDVNNYMAIKKSGGAKTKGLYAGKGLMKNPTMQVCSDMAIEYLESGILPEQAILNHTHPSDFVAIRNVQGGGIQYEGYKKVDDWVETAKGNWRRPSWPSLRASKRRVSRPPPVDVGVGGVPFGRVARWYMTKDKLPPLSYLSSGNLVPKTEGARVCMTLPEKLPKDLDKQWYIDETYAILAAVGVELPHKVSR